MPFFSGTQRAYHPKEKTLGRVAGEAAIKMGFNLLGDVGGAWVKDALIERPKWQAEQGAKAIEATGKHIAEGWAAVAEGNATFVEGYQHLQKQSHFERHFAEKDLKQAQLLRKDLYDLTKTQRALESIDRTPEEDAEYLSLKERIAANQKDLDSITKEGSRGLVRTIISGQGLDESDKPAVRKALLQMKLAYYRKAKAHFAVGKTAWGHARDSGWIDPLDPKHVSAMKAGIQRAMSARMLQAEAMAKLVREVQGEVGGKNLTTSGGAEATAHIDKSMLPSELTKLKRMEPQPSELKRRSVNKKFIEETKNAITSKTGISRKHADLISIETGEDGKAYIGVSGEGSKVLHLVRKGEFELRRGMKGDAVTKLQDQLAAAGVLDQDDITGVYDAATYAAVRRVYPDTIYGVVDADFLDKFDRKFSELFEEKTAKPDTTVARDWLDRRPRLKAKVQRLIRQGKTDEAIKIIKEQSPITKEELGEAFEEIGDPTPPVRERPTSEDVDADFDMFGSPQGAVDTTDRDLTQEERARIAQVEPLKLATGETAYLAAGGELPPRVARLPEDKPREDAFAELREIEIGRGLTTEGQAQGVLAILARGKYSEKAKRKTDKGYLVKSSTEYVARRKSEQIDFVRSGYRDQALAKARQLNVERWKEKEAAREKGRTEQRKQEKIYVDAITAFSGESRENLKAVFGAMDKQAKNPVGMLVYENIIKDPLGAIAASDWVNFSYRKAEASQKKKFSDSFALALDDKGIKTFEDSMEKFNDNLDVWDEAGGASFLVYRLKKNRPTGLSADLQGQVDDIWTDEGFDESTKTNQIAEVLRADTLNKDTEPHNYSAKNMMQLATSSYRHAYAMNAASKKMEKMGGEMKKLLPPDVGKDITARLRQANDALQARMKDPPEPRDINEDFKAVLSAWYHGLASTEEGRKTMRNIHKLGEASRHRPDVVPQWQVSGVTNFTAYIRALHDAYGDELGTTGELNDRVIRGAYRMGQKHKIKLNNKLNDSLSRDNNALREAINPRYLD